MALPRGDLYLPIDPRQVVRGILPESATPMQSAAKVPILVAFTVVAQVRSPLPRQQARLIVKHDGTWHMGSDTESIDWECCLVLLPHKLARPGM